MPPAQRVLRAACLLAAAAVTAFGAGSPSESDLKAAFIYHFTQFVEWPDAAFQADDSPFVIGVLGTDPFGGTLEALVRGESVARHPIRIRILRDGDNQVGCHILFVTRDGEPRLDARRLGASPVLTVGESDQFFDAGGMVEFVTERRHVRIKINLSEARAHGLAISAKLLRVAEVVDDEGGASFEPVDAPGGPDVEPASVARRHVTIPRPIPGPGALALTLPAGSL
ncbi:MAG TPA: YfiR family protein [Opitutaceae bacterium]|jgi:hypothetical protein